MAEEVEAAEEASGIGTVTKTGKLDSIFGKIANYIGTGIQRFVAFLFFLIAIGAIFGYFIAISKIPFGEYLLLAPAVMGIVAYYNRALAIFLFIILILFVFLL